MTTEQEATADSGAMGALIDNATRASALLKTLSNPHRLIALCLLADGEKNVSDLERRLGIRQPTLSQQLSRLRSEGLVTTRREGKEVYYSIASMDTVRIIRVVHDVFCGDEAC